MKSDQGGGTVQVLRHNNYFDTFLFSRIIFTFLVLKGVSVKTVKTVRGFY